MTKTCAFAMYNCILVWLGEKLRLGRHVREKVSSMHDRDMMKRNIDSAAVMIFQPLFCKLGKSQHFTKFSLCLCLSFDKRERKSCIKISLGEFEFLFRDDTLYKNFGSLSFHCSMRGYSFSALIFYWIYSLMFFCFFLLV
jgi:hypothetical protein